MATYETLVHLSTVLSLFWLCVSALLWMILEDTLPKPWFPLSDVSLEGNRLLQAQNFQACSPRDFFLKGLKHTHMKAKKPLTANHMPMLAYTLLEDQPFFSYHGYV